MAIAATTAAVHAATSPVPSVSPSMSPDPTPVVHAALTHVAASSNGLMTLLNSLLGSLSQADIIAAAAAVAVVLQGFINRHPWMQSELAWLQDLKRFAVAVALPYVGTLLASFASGQNSLHLYLPVFVGGQFLFYLFKTLKGVVLTNQAPASDLAQTEAVG